MPTVVISTSGWAPPQPRLNDLFIPEAVAL
jgi:hypothetical protein